MYVIVRTDLSYAQQSVQSTHAAIELYRQQGHVISEQHPHLVLCGVPNEGVLLNLFRKIRSLHIPVVMFREPDLDDSVTAIATGLIDQEDRKHFRSLKLLKLKEPRDVNTAAN